MMRFSGLKRDERGAGVVEFALIAPLFCAFIIAIGQLGLLFFANAGLTNALAEGARLATLFPRPSDAAIASRISQKRFGLDPALLTGPTINHFTPANGATYAEITMTYSAPVNFLFLNLGPVRLTQTRRVYTQPIS
jgi:Flp pilus assembly protein TadG